MKVDPRIDVVVLTYNRRDEAMRTVARMREAEGVGTIVVVDNASDDSTAEEVARRFPDVRAVRLDRNLGAAARNVGVRETSAPYVAFCDDDTWWSSHSLVRAADVLDACPGLGVVTARVLVGDEGFDDPTNARMAMSPFRNELGVRGAQVLGFLAGACVFRRRAFVEAGGYHPRLFIGGEEALLAIDLAVAGWTMAYLPDAIVHHHPSPMRESAARRRLLLRNALWCAWVRRPAKSALAASIATLAAARFRDAASGLTAALRGLRWVLRERRVVPAHVERALARREAFDANFDVGADGGRALNATAPPTRAAVPIRAGNRVRKNDGRNPASPT